MKGVMPDDSRQHAGPIPVISGYSDLAFIAKGGFSSVYKARQERFDRTVAVKVLRADMRDPEARRRFADECRLTGRLSGEPHIITVFDAGTTEDGHPYLAMQYLPGGSLADRVASSGPLPAPEAARIGAAVAAALAAAHEARILHRDIKPGNILMSAENEPVLSDFGVAGRYYPATIVPGAAGGTFTPAYTAPEVQEGSPPSTGSDIYSLGATLYALLAGRPPFAEASGQEDLLARIRAGNLPDLERADLSTSLMALIRRCLSCEAARRPSSARHLAADLAAFQTPIGVAPPAGQRTGAAAVDGGGETPGTLAPATVPDWSALDAPTVLGAGRPYPVGTVPAPRRRRMVPVVIAAVAGAAVLAAVGVLVAEAAPGPGPRPVSAPSPGASHPAASSQTSSRAATRPPAAARTVSPAPVRHSSVPSPVNPEPVTVSAPAPVIHFLSNSVVTLDSASGRGCKAWMNEQNPGSEFQGLVQSWGDDCTMRFRQSANGRSFATVAQENNVVLASADTRFYPGGGGFAMVCLEDYTVKEYACGPADGG